MVAHSFIFLGREFEITWKQLRESKQDYNLIDSAIMGGTVCVRVVRKSKNFITLVYFYMTGGKTTSETLHFDLHKETQVPVMVDYIAFVVRGQYISWSTLAQMRCGNVETFDQYRLCCIHHDCNEAIFLEDDKDKRSLLICDVEKQTYRRIQNIY